MAHWRRRPLPHRTKLLVRKGNRNFVVDAQDVIYATVDNGVITLRPLFFWQLYSARRAEYDEELEAA